MNSICEHPELKLSPHMYLFLKCQEGDLFEKAKKEVEKVINPNTVLTGGPINKKMFYLKNPIKVEHLIRVEGYVECTINSKLKELHVHADNAIKEWTPVYTKCKQTSAQLAASLSTSKSLANQLADEVEVLKRTACKYNDAVGRQSEYHWDILESVYSTLADSIKGLGRH